MNKEEINALPYRDNHFVWKVDRGGDIRYGTTKRGLNSCLNSKKGRFYGYEIYIIEAEWEKIGEKKGRF